MERNAALQTLYQLADENRPPPPELRVRGQRSVVVDVVQEILVAPGMNTKHLLYGAMGSGKSTQLRDIASGLSRDMTVVDVDFDASGISVSGISAFDLAYVIALKTLAHLPRESAEPLFEKLVEAYAEGDDVDASELGRLEQALPGVAGFGDAVIAVAKEAGAALLPGVAIVSSVKAAMNILRLRTKKAGLVSEASPRGRQLQNAMEAIFEAVRVAHGGRPIAVLIDGLEKVNGEAGEWMRQTFEKTQLLAHTSVTMVAATPPCPFTETDSAYATGWRPQIIYGFAPDDLPALTDLVQRRVLAAGLDPAGTGLDAVCARFASEAGGHPRHAMLLLRYAVVNALKVGRSDIVEADVEGAVRRLRELLAMGLIEPHYEALKRVGRNHRLPSSNVAHALFRDGRILVHPPQAQAAPSFHVHPLIAPWIAAAQDVADGDS